MNYLITSSLCLVAFYFVYALLLKADKLMKWQRAYLIAVICLSLTVPLIDLDWHSADYPTTVQNYFIPATTIDNVPEQATSTPIFTTKNIVLSLYFLGCMFMGWRLINTFGRLYQLINTGKISKKNGVTIIHCGPEIPISSFFNYIFLPDNKEYKDYELESILHHEKAHARGLHSADIMLVELTKVFFWFNPVIYLIDRSIRSVHEFISDQAAAQSTGPGQYERLLINTLFRKNQLPLLSHFGEVSIKTRIEKLNQQNPKRMKKLKFILLLPLTAFLIWACDPAEFSEKSLESETNLVTGKIMNLDGNTLPGVNIVVEGTTIGTVADIDGNYSLHAPANSTLVFSFIGMKTQKIEINNRSVIDIELEKGDQSEVPVEREKMFVTLELGTSNGESFVTGIVTDDNDNPLSGVKVIIIGADQGTVTNSNGEYKLKVKENTGRLAFYIKGYSAVIQSFGK